jgi:hypothetical protein
LKGLSAGTVQRELDTLSRLGLIVRSSVGKQVFYQANDSHPVFPELRGLAAKTVGLFQRLHSALEPLLVGEIHCRQEGPKTRLGGSLLGSISKGLKDS